MQKQPPIILVALLVVGLIALLKFQKAEVERRVPAEAPNIDYAPLIRTHADQAGRRNANAIQSFELELNRILQTHETKLENAAENAAKRGADYESCCAVIYYLAWDKIRNTAKTEAYLDDEIDPAIRPAVEALASNVNRAVEALEADLRRSTLLLATDLAALGPPTRDAPGEASIEELTQADFEQSLRNLGLNAVGIGFAISFDAFAITQSRLGKLLWVKIKSIALRLFGKQVAKVAASAAVAAADGPLPIGDILAIGGLIWTGFDIRSSQHEFEKDLRASLSSLLLDTNHEIHKQAVDHATSMLKAHQELQDGIGSRTAKDLAASSR